MSKYTVNVGNIGNMKVTNKAQGISLFYHYVDLSDHYDGGKASKQNVVLFEDGEPILEHTSMISD